MSDFKFIPDRYIRFWNHGITKTYPKIEGTIRIKPFQPIPENVDAQFIEEALENTRQQIDLKAPLSKSEHRKQKWAALEYALTKANEAYTNSDFHNACIAFMELGLCAAEINEPTINEIVASSEGEKAKRVQKRRQQKGIDPSTEKRRAIKQFGLKIGYSLIEKDDLKELRTGTLVEKVRSELVRMFENGELNAYLSHIGYLPKHEAIRKWFVDLPEYVTKPGAPRK